MTGRPGSVGKGSCFLSSMPRSGSTGKQEQQGSVLQSSWEHRDRQLRTHMVVQALQNIGLDSTGCGGERGAQTITIYKAQQKKSHWPGACPRGSRCFSCSPVELTDQNATRQRDAASLLGTWCEERGPGPGKPLPGSIQSQLPVLATLLSDVVTGKSTVAGTSPPAVLVLAGVPCTLSRLDKRNK